MEDLVKLNPLELTDTLRSTYRGKSVLVTGHNGFVGCWLTHWLLEVGAEVVGLSLPCVSGGLAETTRIDQLLEAHIVDIRSLSAIRAVTDAHRFDYVFHLAAQALVLPSYEDPIATFDTNVMGTANVLEALRAQPSVRSCVIVTSDKCYATAARPHQESDPLGGDDPYSASKAAAEMVAHSYRQSFLANEGVGLATARAGNIVGGGDWGEHRIVPDCMKAAAAGSPLELRHPGAVRPWQHVLDAAAGYLRLGASLENDPISFSRAWNFGPPAEASATVGDLVDSLLRVWNQKSDALAPEPVGPLSVTPDERAVLTLDSNLARNSLHWNPLLNLSDTVDWTVEWYWSHFQEFGSDLEILAGQIRRYEQLDHDSQGLQSSSMGEVSAEIGSSR